MSGLDWEKERDRKRRRKIDSQSSDAQRSRSAQHRTQDEADYLATIIEDAKSAKRAGRFFKIPPGISKSDQKLIWARALSELGGSPARP